MADESSALIVAFLGAALMVVGSIMNYNIADEDCDDVINTNNGGTRFLALCAEGTVGVKFSHDR